MKKNNINKLPDWFRKEIPDSEKYFLTKDLLKTSNINTVCKEAKCPNVGECYSAGRAVFMILGDVCTRNCSFCGVTKGKPQKTDKQESLKIKNAVEKLNLKYIVITSVTRDDLSDGGAFLFAEVIRQIRSLDKDLKIEVLVPDFLGNKDSIKTVLDAKPDVFNHNLETIERLYPNVRQQADINRSLNVLKTAKEYNCKILTKSGIMLGLGEKKEEVTDLFRKLRKVGCDILTIGQYLKPTKDSINVTRFVLPKEFEEYKNIALDMGFKYVFSGPLVRSSYHAEDIYKEI